MFKFWSQKNEQEQANTVDSKSAIDKRVADSLYQQNIEITTKNKNLSISRRLYEISVLALTPRELGEDICKVIQTELSFELAGILLRKEGTDLFEPLAFKKSNRLQSIVSKIKTQFGEIALEPKEKNLLKQVLVNKTSLNTTDLEVIWGDHIAKGDYEKIQDEGHVKTIIMSPLVIENTIIGVSVFGLNRQFSLLSDNEIELINSVNNIISIAIDRSVLYGKLKQTNEKLETANERLKQLDKQKSEFVSLASHQIRGPLTAITGYVGMVLQGEYGNINADAKGALQKVQIATKDLAVLVSDYLDVTRIELGRMKYEFERLSFTKLVSEVVDEMLPVIEKNGLTLQTDITEKALMVHADKNKLKQVMLNLVDNSVKYTPEGTITIRAIEDAGKARFEVSDTGIGMNEEIKVSLFEKFVRAPGASKVNIGGTGLGLFVARKIIDEHGGSIWVDSPGEGKGSTFAFTVAVKETNRAA